jgi:hypothetical protein
MVYGDATKRISHKFKTLRRALKKLAKGHQNLRGIIEDVNNLICRMDMVENSRDLYTREWNFRVQLKDLQEK